MNSPLILAAVTAILKNSLENGLAAKGVTAALGSDAAVSALPPDRLASGADEKSQINLFLYQAHAKGLSPSSRYEQAGESARSASSRSLELHYLLTAYGMEDLQGEVLLGYGLEMFADRPVFAAEDIQRALTAISSQSGGRLVSPVHAALSAPGLAGTMHRIKVCPQALEIEEMVNLWSSFQVSYRPSAAYHVTVELTDEAGER